MGDSVPAHHVGTFCCCADDLHTRGILQVVHMRDHSVAWNANLYCIGSGSQVYGSFLAEFLEIHGNAVDDEHCFSCIDRRSVREDYPDFRGHATGMHHGS